MDPKSSTPHLPALVQVDATLVHASPHIAQLVHVVDLISAYLDLSVRFTPPQAAGRGSVSLLDRVLARVATDANVDAAFRSHWLAHALATSIQKNDLRAVQLIHGVHPAPLHVRSLHLALQHGDLAMVQWIVEHRNDRRCCLPGVENVCLTCVKAAVPSSIADCDVETILDWLHGLGVPMAQSPMRLRKNEQVARWLDARGELDVEGNLLASIIENGPPESTPSLQFLLERGHTMSEEDVVGSLVRGSCQRQLAPLIDVVVASRLCDSIRDKVVWGPTRAGGVKVLQWDATYLAETHVYGRIEMTHHLAFYASHFCHTDTLAWLWRDRSVAPASVPIRKPDTEQDLLALYQWMHTNSVDGWCADDAACAARYGFLSTVQWLHQHKPSQLTTSTMDAAALNGHLHILQWLHDHRSEGCSARALQHASQKGHLAVVKWLTSTYPTVGYTNDAMVDAAVGGHVEVVAWLHTNCVDACGACVLHTLLHDASSADAALNVLRWLSNDHSSRAASCVGQCVGGGRSPTYIPLATEVLRNGDVAFAQYLLDDHRELFAVGAVEWLVRDGHLPAIQWLYRTSPESVNWDEVLRYGRETGEHQIAAWAESVIQPRY